MAGPSNGNGKAPGMQAKLSSPAQNTTEVLSQRGKLPIHPAKMAIGGLAFVATVAYFTLYSKKKPEATAIDVARVTTGAASPSDARPSK